MLDDYWRKLLAEKDDMSSVSSVIWTMIIFGGASALIALYLLDTKTDFQPLTKGIAAIFSGVVVGALAASARWFRIVACYSSVILCLLWLFRAFA
jgi:hypothetical protein